MSRALPKALPRALPCNGHECASESVLGTEYEGNEQERAEYLVAGVTEEENCASIQQGLENLQTVCVQRSQLLAETRQHLLNVAAHIAENIALAGLTGELLPRDYQVLEQDGSLYLIKRLPQPVDSPQKVHALSDASLDSSPHTSSEPAYIVLTGQETLFSRLKWKAQALNACDLALFCKDLQEGLLHEFSEYVCASLVRTELSPPRLRLIGGTIRKEAAISNSDLIHSESAPASLHPLPSSEPSLLPVLSSHPASSKFTAQSSAASQIGRAGRRLQIENIGRRRSRRGRKATVPA